MWQHCTPCIKDYRFQYVVDLEHIDDDLDYIIHNELNIHNKTDGKPMEVPPYWDLEGFMSWSKISYENWVIDGYAKNNMKEVEK